ncbi:AIPR family protein [Rhizobium leguminosarum]|nr:AIPR family protein [Rhizobium leguminosarum]
MMRTACSPEDAARNVWDGTDDNGVDAVFHDAAEKRVIIVQSKWIHAGGGEPSASDIALFANGVRDVVEHNEGNFHQRLHARLNDISNAIMEPGTTIEVVLVSTGADDVARHGHAHIDRVLGELNEPQEDPMATKQIVGLDEVYTSLATSSTGSAISVTANLTDWSYVAQPYAAYFGLIDGLQLKEWWDTWGKRIIAKNIRHNLGATDVNEAIRQTAENAPIDFWYFNNGITLIAEERSRAPKMAASRSSGIFVFKGVSVVNGAQTISTLARVAKEENLGQVRVSIRVVVLSEAPINFGQEVTRTNNLQNRIEGRDFVAQDPQQSRIQQEMSMEGVDYQFLRSEDAALAKGEKSCELIEVTTALACAAGDPALAVNVKTGIGRFFNDLTKGNYKTIFNPKTSGAKAYNAVLVQRRIDTWIDSKKKALGKKSGYPWGALVHGNRIISAAVFKLIGADKLDATIEQFFSNIEEIGIPEICEKAYDSIVDALNNQFPDKVLAILFKSPVRSKEVFDHAVSSAAPPQSSG